MPELNELGGITSILEEIRGFIHLPLKHGNVFEKLKVDPPKGILICGNPGTGKYYKNILKNYFNFN